MTISLPYPKTRLKLSPQINPSQILSIILLTIHFLSRLRKSAEIKNIISKLNNNKYTGPNNLPSKILRTH